MDPVQIRIDAEVADALRKVLKLRSDFINFKDEYKKAISEMDRVNTSMSGDKLTRTVTQYLAVIKQIGGVNALTAAEQAKVNKILTEASEKYLKLGREVPQVMQQIIFATSQASAKSATELDKITKAISGDKIVQQAALYMQALTRVNDVNRLTESQQQKVNKILTEAAEVYRRLGVQVPADMQRIIDATTKVKPATDELKKLRDMLSGEGSLRSASQYVKVIAEIGGVSKLSAADQKKLLTVLDQMEARFQALGRAVPADIKRIHDELRKLGAAKDEVRKLEEALSGKNITREASNWVEAVRRVGGVTRLTSDEQKKLNGILTEAAAKYRALGQQVPGDVQRLLQATTAAGNGTRNVFSRLWVDIAKGSAVGNLAANAVAAAWRGVKDMISGARDAMIDFIARGSQVDRIASSFEKLIPANEKIVTSARSVSTVTQEMIEAAKRGSSGLITSFEAMRAANQAVLFGLPLTIKEMETLARVSVTLGRAMDLDAGRALNDLIIGLGRSSPRILDNLGIIVKMVDANEKYAKSIGKSRLELNAEERTFAFYTESMRKMGLKVEEIGEIHVTAADKVQLAKVKFTDIRDEAARWVAQSPVLNRAIEGVGEIILRAFGGDKKEAIRALMNAVAQGTIFVVKTFETAIPIVGAGAGAFSFFTAEIIHWRAELIRGNIVFLEVLARMQEGLGKIPLLGAAHRKAAEQIREVQKTILSAFGDPVALDKRADNIWATGSRIMGTFKTMQGSTQRLIGELETLAMLDPFKTIKKSAENLPNIVNNDQANAEAEAGLSKAQAALLKRQEAFNIAWDKELAKTRAAQEAHNFAITKLLADWYREYDKVGQKMNEMVFKRLEAQNFNKFIQPILDRIKLESEIEELHRTKAFTWVDILNKMGGITRDPGKDPTKWFDKGAIGTALDSLAKSIPQMLATRLATQGASIPTAIASQVASALGQSFMGPKGFLGKKLGGLFGGALGETFKSMLPVIGALAGPVLEKIISFFSGKKWKDSMKTVGREWGISITEELAKKIKEDSEKLFGGDRRVAEAFNFSAILGDTKITEKNFDILLGKLRDVFVFVSQGKMSVEQAQQVLNENFAKFAEHVEKSGELASDKLLEFIDLNRQFKTESEAIHNFLLNQSSKLGGALSTMANDTTEKYKGLGEELRNAQEEIERIDREIAESRGKGDSVDDLLKQRAEAMIKVNEIMGRQGEAAKASQEEFERLGRLILASYNAMIKEGLSAEEIAERLGPAWSRLLQIQKDLGIQTNNVALQEQLNLQKAREQNAATFEAAAAVNETAKALFNMRGMSQETFDDLQDQMQTTFTRLQGTGITHRQALEQVLPFLRTAIELNKRNGLAIDDTTQMYIDQANELDLLGEVTETEAEKQKRAWQGIGAGLAAIVEALGGTIPQALRDMLGATEEAADGAEDQLERIADSADSAAGNFGELIGKLEDVGSVARDSAEEAINAFRDLENQAHEAAGAVTEIAEGRSPGGFRGIIVRAGEAQRAVTDFTKSSDPALRELYETINQVNPGFPRQNVIPNLGGTPVLMPTQGYKIPELLERIKLVLDKPRIIIESGAITTNLQAYGIADREAIERTITKASLRNIAAHADEREDFERLIRRVVPR